LTNWLLERIWLTSTSSTKWASLRGRVRSVVRTHAQASSAKVRGLSGERIWILEELLLAKVWEDHQHPNSRHGLFAKEWWLHHPELEHIKKWM
jgi:hypothetical protein